MKKKLLKLIILMIAVLLNCSKIYAQDIPSTGEVNNSDTSLVTIPINYIRLANEKLIERNYLIEVNEYKDSIITDYKKLILEYKQMEKDYELYLEEYERINNRLNKRLQKQKKTSLVLGTIAGVSVTAIVLAALIN